MSNLPEKSYIGSRTSRNYGKVLLLMVNGLKRDLQKLVVHENIETNSRLNIVVQDIARIENLAKKILSSCSELKEDSGDSFHIEKYWHDRPEEDLDPDNL